MMDAMIGAVILAAGKSSRMGAFKPMLRLGEESAARRIVKTLKAGGAQAVLVVTGRQAEELRQHTQAPVAPYDSIPAAIGAALQESASDDPLVHHSQGLPPQHGFPQKRKTPPQNE